MLDCLLLAVRASRSDGKSSVVVELVHRVIQLIHTVMAHSRAHHNQYNRPSTSADEVFTLLRLIADAHQATRTYLLSKDLVARLV